MLRSYDMMRHGYVCHSNLQLLPQKVQPIANPINLCPGVWCVPILIYVCSLFNMPIIFQIIEKKITSVVRSGKDRNSGYPRY